MIEISFLIQTGSDKIIHKLCKEFNNIQEAVFVHGLKTGKTYIHGIALINPKKQKKFKNAVEGKLQRKMLVVGITKSRGNS